MPWTHPKWGDFEHDGSVWTSVIEIPAFAQFSYDTGFSKAKRRAGKHELQFESDSEDKPPSAEQIKLAESVVFSQSRLVKTITKAIWDDIIEKGPGSGMWWNGGLDQIGENLDQQALKGPDDLLPLLKVCAIVVEKKRRRRSMPFAEICFHAAFTDEHGVSVLTDGKAVLGIGRIADVEPFGT